MPRLIALFVLTLFGATPEASSQIEDLSACTATRRFANPDPHPPVRCAITSVPGPAHIPECSTQDHFGSSFAVGGDFDGDGVPDLVIGGSCHPEAEAQSTQAWLYLKASNAPTIIFDGNGHTDLFGSVLCFVPDLDGDGRDELAVGAPAASGSGRVFLFFGFEPDRYRLGDRRPALTHADVVIQGAVNGGRFGASLAAGDVDGDGTPDLIVGAPGSGSSDAAGFAGSVAWFSGAELAADRHLRGDEPADEPDVESEDAGPSDLRLLLASSAKRTWLGLLAADRFGHSLALAGELDGTPGVEILAGAPQLDSTPGSMDPVPTGSGYAVVLSVAAAEPTMQWGPLQGDSAVDDGSATGTSAALPLQFGEGFGTAVAAGRDLSGDGIPDLVIGAPFYADLGSQVGDEPNRFADNGRVWFLSGADGALFFGTEASTPALTSPYWRAKLGSALVFVDDATGDGQPDLLVGARGEASNETACPWNRSQTVGGVASGAVHVVDGRTGLSVVRITGETRGDHLGQAIAGYDMDGDGLAEVFCSAPSWSPGNNRASQKQSGRAYMMLGSHLAGR
jgi:hypothetical protein